REELRLPVLEGPLPEVGASQVPRPAERLLEVLDALVAVFGPARQRLAQPRAGPDEAHDDHERVLVDLPPHAASASPRRRLRARVASELLLRVVLTALLAELLRLG